MARGARGLPRGRAAGGRSTSTRLSRSSARSARPSAPAGARRSPSLRCDSTASPPSTSGCRARRSTDALAALDPAVRAGLEESIRRLRRTCQAELEHEVVTDLGAGRPRHPPLAAGPPRRPLRPRRPRAAGLQRGDERRTGAGRGRGVHRPGQLAADGPRRSPRADDPGRLRAARGRRGVRRRRGAGDRDVRLRRGGVRAGRPGHRPRQHLHGRGQAAAQGRRRDRLRGRSDRDRDPGRRQRRRGVRRRRPDQPGRARPGGRQRARHRLASGWPTMSRPSSTSRCSRPGTPSGSGPPSAGQQSGIVLVDDLDQGLAVVNAYAAEHLEIQTARRRPRWRAGSATPGAIFVGPFAPVSLGDYCAGSNHVLPTAGCACHSSGLSVRAFRKAVHVVDYSREALAEVADHVVTLAEAEDLPGPRRGRHGPVRPMSPVLPLREELRGLEPYGAPQLDVPVRLNVNENPYPPSVGRGGRHRARRRRGRARRSTATPTASSSPCARRSRPTSGTASTPAQVWAANGSNEVMLHLLQAFGGPGRLALSFAPTYSMYPEYARDTHTALGGRAPRGGLHPRPRPRGRRWSGHGDHTSYSCRRRTTRPAPPSPPEVVAALCEAAGRRAAWSSTRRTPSSVAPAPRARWSCSRRHPQPGRHPHDEQGVRAGRRPASATSRRRRRSATRSASSACPTTSRR